jgi:hypothetical protein
MSYFAISGTPDREWCVGARCSDKFLPNSWAGVNKRHGSLRMYPWTASCANPVGIRNPTNEEPRSARSPSPNGKLYHTLLAQPSIPVKQTDPSWSQPSHIRFIDFYSTQVDIGKCQHKIPDSNCCTCHIVKRPHRET